MTAVNTNLCVAEYTLCHPTVAHFVTKARIAVLCWSCTSEVNLYVIPVFSFDEISGLFCNLCIILEREFTSFGCVLYLSACFYLPLRSHSSFSPLLNIDKTYHCSHRCQSQRAGENSWFFFPLPPKGHIPFAFWYSVNFHVALDDEKFPCPPDSLVSTTLSE